MFDLRIWKKPKDLIFAERNWVFAILISLQPDGVNLWYFKLKLFDLTSITTLGFIISMDYKIRTL